VRVDQREEHVVDANPNGEHDDGSDGKTAFAGKQPGGEANILEQGVDDRQASLIAMQHLDLVNAAKAPPRRQPRIVGRHPCRDVLVGQPIEVILYLL
jgi:hypothetical protein